MKPWMPCSTSARTFERQRRAVTTLQRLGAITVGGLLVACGGNELGRSRTQLRRATVWIAPAAAEPSASSTSPLIGTAEQGHFLVASPQGEITMRSSGGERRVVVSHASSWLYDPHHALLWFLQDDWLSVIDLREQASTLRLANLTTAGTGAPLSATIAVEWPANDAARFVREETGCEPWSELLELNLGETSTLTMALAGRDLPLSSEALTWLAARARRAAPPALVHSVGGFYAADLASRVALPKGWGQCDDAERCGLAVPFGERLRLVLVRDRFGADCWHRSCLLFDPATNRFASPPLLADEESGTLSPTAGATHWSAASDANSGVCGPYYFNANGSAFLVRGYRCALGGQCEPLDGEGLGWLDPGAIVGEPG